MRSIRFDRNEISGAFGDIGTDFPLIAGMILASSLDAASVLTMFGALQVVTGLIYRLPMPTQPLKAMAVLVITQRLAPDILYGGGLAIGLVMLALTLTGLVDRLAAAVPKAVVRGIQFGLGLQLSALALKDYAAAEGAAGWVLAGLAFALTIALLGNRRLPPAPLLIALGVGYALFFKRSGFLGAVGLHLPSFHLPQPGDVLAGFLILALPQIPLSLGNSILATRQVAEDLFPHRPIGVRKIAFTYSLMNLVNPFFSGIPTCHGSGGMVGHYTFGARTGGSVILYGLFYLILGLFLSPGFRQVLEFFPKPVLGVILLFEGLGLMRLTQDSAASQEEFGLVLLVGLMAFGLPYGYVVGLVVGTLLAALSRKNLLR